MTWGTRVGVLNLYLAKYILQNMQCFVMPLPLGAGGIMLSVRPSIRPKPEITSFHLYMGPLVHPTNRDCFAACPSVRPSVRLSVEEVPGHLPENAWREWSKILHVDVSWAPSELIRLWSWSVDFPNLGGGGCYLVKWVKFGGSGYFLENPLRKWPAILHADVSWAPSELIR